MVDYLEAIVAHHRAQAANDVRLLRDVLDSVPDIPAPRGFANNLRTCSRVEGRLGVIAEYKRRSPSRGVIADREITAQVAAYCEGGAIGVSVLTDVEYFAGSLDDLEVTRRVANVALLRKDFVVDARDVVDARIHGADMVLLIAAILTPGQLREFSTLAHELSLDVLIEIHSLDHLEATLAASPDVVGINQRDLVSFSVDTDHAGRLRSHLPNDVLSVAESGVTSVEDALRLRQVGFDAVLIGEMLMCSENPADLIKKMTTPTPDI
jgi:indole-3-glycerol phosphate synthase